jgi:protein ImuA
MRWRVTALPSTPLTTPGLGRPRLQVELLRCRGVPAGSDLCCWVVEACDEAGRLRVPVDLADRLRPQLTLNQRVKVRALAHPPTISGT